jgi:phosphatidylserine/phosphatidylglycerophosphate/cardiolipin synthase-like enzyme
MTSAFEVRGQNPAALFTLKLYRGEGMALLAMNWKHGQPPVDFVGFAIEYKEPQGQKFFVLKNRLGFLNPDGQVNPNQLSTRLSPIQKFRWVHFPRNADLPGEFVYRVSPVFMNARDELSYGEFQEAAIALRQETYPGVLNVTFTRGFVSSQAFVDRFVTPQHGLSALIPAKADDGLDFVPTHPQAQTALDWMGFEAREVILDLLDRAIQDPTAQVRVVAYDLNEPEVVTRLERLGPRLQIIIDDSDSHGEADSAETHVAQRLAVTAGATQVKRQHMGNLQHNKLIMVQGPKLAMAVCGSTNFTWRGFFVQANNALVVQGPTAVKPFWDAFDAYWQFDTVAKFGKTAAANWANLNLPGIDAQVSFSPHIAKNALLATIAQDVSQNTTSSLFYSLAFLYQTKGALRSAIETVTQNDQIFVYGMSDRKSGGGLDLQKPGGNVSPVYPAALSGALPEPFKSEPTGLAGGVGTRMHHKFVVVDFDRPTARVYLGSHNFSTAADTQNGENLLLIRDRRIAVSYMLEALRLFDHYHFRVAQQDAGRTRRVLGLAKPPRRPGEVPWWQEDYVDARKIRDRQLFGQ